MLYLYKPVLKLLNGGELRELRAMIVYILETVKARVKTVESFALRKPLDTY